MIMKQQFRISKEERKLIEDAVLNAEKKTCGEIVPMIVRQSDDYGWIPWFWSGIFVALTTLVLWFASSHAPWAISLFEKIGHFVGLSIWGVTLHDAIIAQSFAAVLGYAVGCIELIKRKTLPKQTAAENVHRQCMANFVAAGLTQTRDRSGVLIFLSHLEHRVEILADKGIYEKVPATFWKEQSDKIVTGIRKGVHAQALADAILTIGNTMAEPFPRRADDMNELPNRVLVEHQMLNYREPTKRS